jgi:NADPH-dependent curcumin reductase CurA
MIDMTSIVTVDNVKKVAKVAIPIAAGAVGLKAISIAKEKSKAKKVLAAGEPVVNSAVNSRIEKKIQKLEAKLDKLKQKLPQEQPSSEEFEEFEEEEIQEQLLELGGANE